jgi:hypothetical protein
MRKRWCHDRTTRTSDNWKRERDMVRWVVLHAVPYIRKSLLFENTQGNLQSNSETRRRFCDGLGSNIVVQYSLDPIITLHGRITVRECVDRLGNQVHPMIQTLFPINDAVFQDDSVPITQLECSVMVWRAWEWTAISSLTSTITRFGYHWITLVSDQTLLWLERGTDPPPPTSLKQLQEEWYKIPLDSIQNLYESIPRRNAAVLRAKGGPTPY